jgi:hypothetical protein
MRFVPSPRAMDFDWGSQKPPAALDHSASPSLKHESGVFGEPIFHDMFERNLPPWNLGELGYSYDAPHIYPDGRIEGGLHPPNYYAYEIEPVTWEDVAQEIENFNWSGEKEEGSPLHQLRNETQKSGEDSVPETIVSPISTAVEDRSVCGKIPSDKVQLHPSEDILDNPIQNLRCLSATTATTPIPNISKAEKLYNPLISPPWIPEPVPKQNLSNSASHVEVGLSVQENKAEAENQNARASNLMEIDSHSPVADTVIPTRLEEDSNTDEQEREGFHPELRVSEDENLIGHEVTAANETNFRSGKKGHSEAQVYTASNIAEATEAAPLLVTEVPYQMQDQPGTNHTCLSQGHAYIDGNIHKVDGLDELDQLAILSDREEEERIFAMTGCSVEIENTSDSVYPSSTETGRQVKSRGPHSAPGSDKDLLLPATVSDEPPVEAPTMFSPPNRLVPMNDRVDERWETQLQEAADSLFELCTRILKGDHTVPDEEVRNVAPNDTAVSEQLAPLEQHDNSRMTLPPLPLQTYKEESRRQSDENSHVHMYTIKDGKLLTAPGAYRMSSELSEVPSLVTRAIYDIPTNKLQNKTAEDCNTNVATTKIDELVTTSKDPEAHWHSDSRKKARYAIDTDADARPKKKVKRKASDSKGQGKQAGVSASAEDEQECSPGLGLQKLTSMSQASTGLNTSHATKTRSKERQLIPRQSLASQNTTNTPLPLARKTSRELISIGLGRSARGDKAQVAPSSPKQPSTAKKRKGSTLERDAKQYLSLPNPPNANKTAPKTRSTRRVANGNAKKGPAYSAYTDTHEQVQQQQEAGQEGKEEEDTHAVLSSVLAQQNVLDAEDEDYAVSSSSSSEASCPTSVTIANKTRTRTRTTKTTKNKTAATNTAAVRTKPATTKAKKVTAKTTTTTTTKSKKEGQAQIQKKGKQSSKTPLSSSHASSSSSSATAVASSAFSSSTSASSRSQRVNKYGFLIRKK